MGELPIGERQSISFKLIRPPGQVSELVELSKANCSCERVNENKCLICGEVLCGNCFYEHKKKHGSSNIFLYFYSMQVQFETGRRSERADVYENEFHIPYYQSSYEEREKHTFLLHERRVEEIMRKFFEQ